MNNLNLALPPELDAHLRDEPDAEELKRVWNLLGEIAPAPDETGEDAAWQRLRGEALGASTVQTEPTAQTRPAARAPDRPARRADRRTRRRLWVPALAAALFLAGWVYLSAPVTVTASPGSFASLDLPDGSTVDLNSGSAVTYDRGFWNLPLIAAEARTVRLTGEAFFEVEHGDRPFVVETAGARVQVLGTSFNVRARGAETVVTVAEGRVQVEGAAEAGPVVLEAGGRARVVGGVPTPEASGTAHALVWRDQGFAVQEQPLATILSELERRYALDIDLTAAETEDGGLLTLYYPQPTEVETILRDICTDRELNYRRTSRGFEIY
ncbi:MAG: FecR domain-containing protein [Bacteroidota bacterium]